MKSDYRLYCNNCAATRWTGYVADTPTVCPTCQSANINESSIAIVASESTPEKEIHVSCGGSSNSSTSVTGTTWTTIRKVSFLGTSVMGTPSTVSFDASASAGTGSVRLRDLTNNNNIASKTNVTSEGMYKDSVTKDWPANEATLAVQAKADAADRIVSVSEVVIGW